MTNRLVQSQEQGGSFVTKCVQKVIKVRDETTRSGQESHKEETSWQL